MKHNNSAKEMMTAVTDYFLECSIIFWMACTQKVNEFKATIKLRIGNTTGNFMQYMKKQIKSLTSTGFEIQHRQAIGIREHIFSLNHYQRFR